MNWNFEKNLKFLTFKSLKTVPKLYHASFSRYGGFSQGPYKGLNTSLSVGDVTENVLANRTMLQNFFGFEHLIFANQVHGTKILINPLESNQEADILITTKPGLAVGIMHADCQAALICDPTKKIAAAVHAGWKGQNLNIYHEAISCLKDLGCLPQDLIIAICPSLGSCHSEFQNYQATMPKNWSTYDIGNSYIDLKKMALDQLTSLGVLETNITISSDCTYCDPSSYYSYRYSKITGRVASIIGWQKDYIFKNQLSKGSKNNAATPQTTTNNLLVKP